MSNIQLLLAIGIPSFLVVLSWLSNNSRHERTEKRLDDLAASTSKRFDDLSTSIDKRFEDTNRRFDDLLAANHRDALEILRSMTALHERVAIVEAKQNS